MCSANLAASYRKLSSERREAILGAASGVPEFRMCVSSGSLARISSLSSGESAAQARGCERIACENLSVVGVYE